VPFLKKHVFIHAALLSRVTLGGRDLARGAEEPDAKWGDGLDMFALHETELGTNKWRGKAMHKTSHGHDEEGKNSDEERVSATHFG